MKLAELAPDILTPEAAVRRMVITGVTADSRQVQPGTLFAALPGTRVQGTSYIPQAIEHMRRALAMNPTALESMVVLGMALNQAGRLAEAEATLRDGLIVEPEDTALLAVLGRTLVLQGRRAEAEAIRERFIAMSATRYVSPTDRANIESQRSPLPLHTQFLISAA